MKGYNNERYHMVLSSNREVDDFGSRVLNRKEKYCKLTMEGQKGAGCSKKIARVWIRDFAKETERKSCILEMLYQDLATRSKEMNRLAEEQKTMAQKAWATRQLAKETS